MTVSEHFEPFGRALRRLAPCFAFVLLGAAAIAAYVVVPTGASCACLDGHASPPAAEEPDPRVPREVPVEDPATLVGAWTDDGAGMLLLDASGRYARCDAGDAGAWRVDEGHVVLASDAGAAGQDVRIVLSRTNDGALVGVDEGGAPLRFRPMRAPRATPARDPLQAPWGPLGLIDEGGLP